MSDRANLSDALPTPSPNGRTSPTSPHQNSQNMIRIRGARQHNSQEYRLGTAARSLNIKPLRPERSPMTVSKNYIYVSPEDYLEGEKISPIKHEYIRGEVYAMTGASKAHDVIAGNIFALVRNHVRGTGCRTHTADMKVRIEAVNVFYYPDTTVTCDERDNNFAEDFIRYPRLVVEVLSPSTEAFNRGGKFADYRTIETLQEYVLISQQQVSVERFRRNAEGLWVLYPYSAGDEIYLQSINFHCPIAALYEDVLGLS